MTDEQRTSRRHKSGAQKRRERQERAAREGAEHRQRLRDRGQIAREITPCDDPAFAHLWILRQLLDLYVEVDADVHMTFPERIRHLTAIAGAIAKINLQADMERLVLELRARDKERVQKFQALQARLELEARLSRERSPGHG